MDMKFTKGRGAQVEKSWKIQEQGGILKPSGEENPWGWGQTRKNLCGGHEYFLKPHNGDKMRVKDHVSVYFTFQLLSVLRSQVTSFDMLCNLAYIKMLTQFDIKLRLRVSRGHSVRNKSTVLNGYIFPILYTLAAYFYWK